MKLLVEMGKLSPCVLEEKLADKNERSSKHVDRQDSDVPQDGCRVRVPENLFVGNKESQLTHEPEAQCQQNGDGDQQDVGNDRNSPTGLVLFFPVDRNGMRR